MKKYAFLQKIGYTAGVYGCSGEYFSLLLVNKDTIRTCFFYSLYGGEEKIINFLRNEKKYQVFKNTSIFTQLKNKQVKGIEYSDYNIDFVKNIVKDIEDERYSNRIKRQKELK